jgi:hypothetical protein
MRLQYHLIAVLLSMIIWVMSFDVARDAYHDAEEAGAIPNLHLHNHFHLLIRNIKRESSISI